MKKFIDSRLRGNDIISVIPRLDRGIQFLILCALIFLSACASDLYIKNLRMDITNAPYSQEEYILGQFDCSNMASLLDQHLGKKGYDSKLMAVQEVNGRHIYVLIDNETIVEPVTKKILKGKNPHDYPGAVIFNNPEMLQAYLEPDQWEKEWDYKRRTSNLEHRTVLKGIGKGFLMAGAICIFAYFFAEEITEG